MFGLFSYYELFDSREISWDLYCSRTEATIKPFERATELLEFLENTEFGSSEIEQEVAFLNTLDEIVSQLLELARLNKIMRGYLCKATAGPKR